MKLAIVGFGTIAEKHLEVFRALGAQVVASCNRSDLGRARARAAGIAQTFDQVEAMLEEARPDGVLCTASIPENFAAAKRILPFGIPTLLEKPPGIRPDELDELARLSTEHRTPVMLALNRLHYSVLERALDDAGGLGAITSVHVEWSEDPGHLLKRGFSHDQILRRNCSNSVHGISFISHLAGDLEDFHMAVHRIEAPYRFQMGFQGRSRRDVSCFFRSSWDAPIRWRLAFTTRGRSYEFAPLEQCIVRHSSERTIEPAQEDLRYKPGFHRQARRFLDVMRTKAVPAPFTLEAFRPTMRLADSLSRAIECA